MNDDLQRKRTMMNEPYLFILMQNRFACGTLPVPFRCSKYPKWGFFIVN